MSVGRLRVPDSRKAELIAAAWQVFNPPDPIDTWDVGALFVI
jgi:hypothetical protein